jgi:DNA-directed RNA polymerase subunit RPC12/RpoP
VDGLMQPDGEVMLLAKCIRCERLFSAEQSFGIKVKYVISKDNQARCPHCGLDQKLPDVSFRTVLEHVSRIFAAEENPLGFAKELIGQLSTVTDEVSLQKLKASSPQVRKIAEGFSLTLVTLTFLLAVIQTIIAYLSLSQSQAPAISVEQIIKAYNAGLSNRPVSVAATPAVIESPKPQPQPASTNPPKKRQGSHSPPKPRNDPGRRKRSR